MVALDLYQYYQLGYLGERWEGERDMAMALDCRDLSKNVTLI